MWNLTALLLLPCSILICLVLSSYLLRWKMKLKYRRLPPGPFCWPILGHPTFLDRYNNPSNLKKFAERYGGIFGLYIGTRYVVIIDDFEALKNSNQREEFLGRPDENFLPGPDPTQVGVFSMSGQQWMEHKKFWVNAIRHMTSRDRDLKNVIMDQIQQVVSNLRTYQGKDVRVDHLLEVAIYNVTFYLGFGKTFPKDHSIIQIHGEYDKALLRWWELNVLKTFYPWLGKLVALLPQYRCVRRNLTRMDKVISNEILEHQKTWDANDHRDFIDLFLHQMQRTGMEADYNISKLIGTIKVLMAASSETTRNSLVWFFLLMAKYSEIQEEIQQEIDSTVGREREPLLEDRSRLPLLDATIMESMRYYYVFTLSIPRRVLRDTELHGYDIPKDSLLFYNITSHFRNPKYWEDPERFDPDRFLSPDRKKVQVPEHFIPFSYGKRNCVGEKVANSTFFLFSASLLQKFTVLPPECGINMNIKVTFTNGQENPALRFRPRS